MTYPQHVEERNRQAMLKARPGSLTGKAFITKEEVDALMAPPEEAEGAIAPVAEAAPLSESAIMRIACAAKPAKAKKSR